MHSLGQGQTSLGSPRPFCQFRWCCVGFAGEHGGNISGGSLCLLLAISLGVGEEWPGLQYYWMLGPFC